MFLTTRPGNICLLIALSALCSEPHAGDTGRDARARGVRNLLGSGSPAFLQLARRIENGSTDEKAEFARVSLEEMGLAYTEEAQKAREQKPDPNKPFTEDRDPRKWASSTDAYANRLFGFSESILMGAHTDVQVTPEGAVMVFVDEKTVIVSGPRLDQPELLENRIIDRICLDPECTSVATSSFSAGGYAAISGRWNFADSTAPVFATNNGLNFLFEDGTNLAAKERACTDVANELNTIVQALKNLVSQGHPPDWGALAVRPDSGDTGLHVLRINQAQDFIKMPLPQLVQTPYVLQSALPWVRAQVEGRRTEHYVTLPPYIFE